MCARVCVCMCVRRMQLMKDLSARGQALEACREENVTLRTMAVIEQKKREAATAEAAQAVKDMEAARAEAAAAVAALAAKQAELLAVTLTLESTQQEAADAAAAAAAAHHAAMLEATARCEATAAALEVAERERYIVASALQGHMAAVAAAKAAAAAAAAEAAAAALIEDGSKGSLERATKRMEAEHVRGVAVVW